MKRFFLRAGWGILLAVFTLGLIGKLADPAGFAFQLEDLGVPGAWAWPLALAILFVELLIASGLVLRPYRRRAAAAAGLLLLAFAAALAWLVMRGNAGAECGCFGTLISLRIEPVRVFENVALALLAAGVAFGQRPHARYSAW